ncbi:MAG TPA: protein-glutamine gamma-glutamyltransferase [Clostridiales bacterium]|nr:protein-glutamine gamma-glutamyltransferase [Clostridiales bacterium]HOL91131.1 protein-glutamine gamma-glutamyltransferase [Clostridiales bacterium]HPP35631.1 protein-glutamine gamma-glutamyltransferase [Clostridiales bacterium]
MIRFEDGFTDLPSIMARYRRGSPEYEVLSKLSESSRVYTYLSPEELEFEIGLRRGIIEASLALFRGRLAFRIFQESFCNERYWERRQDGGFVLRAGVRPSEAVDDIFANTRRYGTECATAIVMIFYKAVLDAYKPDLFDRTFTRIVLMNWRDMDPLIDPATYRGLADYIPGDCRYIRNPDVDPLTPEWQGENVIDLGGGRYYGHGIGLGDMDFFIEILNRNRREGAQVSAYLVDSATRPDFRGLYLYWKNAS